MPKTVTTISLLAVCMTLSLLLEFACCKKDRLNSNDRAEVAQAVSANANTNNALAENEGPTATPQAQAQTHGTTATPQVQVETNANRGSRPPQGAITSVMRPPTREDVERNKEYYQQQARDEGRTIGNGPDDIWLWAETRYFLVVSHRLPDSKIRVDVDNGVVTLSGTVANQEQLKEAESIVREFEGVKGVQNSLTVGLPE
jgi:osmotically-inducible protein OsmY